MGGLWDTIRNEENRKVITWLCGGLVALAVAGWTLFTYFDARKGPPAPPITITTPPEQLALLVKVVTEPLERWNQQQQGVIRELERKLGVNEGALTAFFRILGEQAVPPEKLADNLAEIAQHYRALRDQVAAAPGDAPAIARLKNAARAALDQVDLEGADMRLTELLAAQDAAIDARQVEAAATLAQRGQIALTRLRYPEAAGHFASAAVRVPPASADRLKYLDAEAQALYRQGEEKGDNAALQQAIACYRELSRLRPRNQVPLDWAMTQNNLGIALSVLGERESGTERLKDAAQAFRAALEERTRARVPLYWAATQNNLGNALLRLGERESGTERLNEAVQAYRAALGEYTRARAPLQWAMTQSNLGSALLTLYEQYATRRWNLHIDHPLEAVVGVGPPPPRTELLEEAVKAFRSALEVRTRDRLPLDWAATQDNLGTALMWLGEHEIESERILQALAAYRARLKEGTRNQQPRETEMIGSILGGAIFRFGDGDSGTARLEEAIAAFRAALEERTRARVPLKWAATQNNLGTALQTLGEWESGTERLKEAVQAYRAALEERTRERVPLEWAGTQNNLGKALFTLGRRTQDPSQVRAARDAIQGAFEVYMQAGQEHLRANFEGRLAEIDQALAALGRSRP